jgi:hypothetical protein
VSNIARHDAADGDDDVAHAEPGVRRAVAASFNGTAADNVGVTTARVAIKNVANNLWWRSNNTWGAYQAQNATLGTLGGTRPRGATRGRRP